MFLHLWVRSSTRGGTPAAGAAAADPTSRSWRRPSPPASSRAPWRATRDRRCRRPSGGCRLLRMIRMPHASPAPRARLLAEQRQEDLRLLLAEPRQGLEPLQHLAAVGIALLPDRGRVAAPVVDDRLRERLHPPRHRAREPVHGRRLLEQLGEVLGVVAGERSRDRSRRAAAGSSGARRTRSP